MKIEYVIADREGWYELILHCNSESGLLSASLNLRRSGRMISTLDDDEAALLLDVLLAHPEEGSQYRNDSFLLQRNYDRVQAKLYEVYFPSYPFDMFALIGKPFSEGWKPKFSKTDRCEYIGSLPPEKFLELSSKLAQLYSTSEPLGEMASWVGPPWAKDVPRIHEWEGYHDLPKTPMQWFKEKWAELNRKLMTRMLVRKQHSPRAFDPLSSCQVERRSGRW